MKSVHLLLMASASLHIRDGRIGPGPARPRRNAQPTHRVPVQRGQGRPIPGRFIITLQERTDPHAVIRDNGVEADFVYTRAIIGFAGRMSDAARSGLLRDNRVVRVEQDREALLQARSVGARPHRPARAAAQRPYARTASGRGVTAYVVDTGIRFDHQEFGGRAARGFDAIGDGQNGDDCNGHGTHVAGTIGGADARRRAGGSPGLGAGARLRRQRHDERPDRRARLGRRQCPPARPSSTVAGRRRRSPRSTMRCAGSSPAASRSRRRPATRASDACTALARAGGRGAHGRRERPQRRPAVLLELRPVRRSVRARGRDRVRLAQRHQCGRDRERNLDGGAARGGRRRSAAPAESGDERRGAAECDHGERDPKRRHERADREQSSPLLRKRDRLA